MLTINNTRWRVLGGALALFLLVACQAAVPEPTVTVAPTAEPVAQVVTATVEPTAAPTETATAVPPTETPSPTETPTPTQFLTYIAYYGGRPAGAWDEANFEAYLAQHPELEAKRIGFSIYSNPVPQSIHGRVTSDEPADVISSYIVGNLRTYVEQGYIADISDLWAEQEWYEQFPQSLIDLVTIDGKQYFVPQAVQWNPIFYRTDIFAEVGLEPPQTWDELLDSCQTLTNAGYIPFTVSSVSWTPPVARWFSYLNLRLNGPAFHEQLMRGKVPYDGPEVRAVFDHWQQLINAGCFSESRVGYRDAAQQIYNGEAAMYNLGEWLSESYADGFTEAFGAFSFPVIDPAVAHSEVVHLYGAFMLSGAPNPEEARELLAYLGSAESQASNVAAIGRLASNLEVDQSSLLPIYAEMQTAVSEAEHITQLFELNTHPDMAEKGLRVFVNFFNNPDIADVLVEDLEAERLRVFGGDDE